MVIDRFDRVTEAQRECLRLVLTRRNSKEIAQELGISSHTVDKRLERAIATLGLTSRFDAARMLGDYERASGTYEPFVYQSPDIVPPAAPSEPQPPRPQKPMTPDPVHPEPSPMPAPPPDSPLGPVEPMS